MGKEASPTLNFKEQENEGQLTDNIYKSVNCKVGNDIFDFMPYTLFVSSKKQLGAIPLILSHLRAVAIVG